MNAYFAIVTALAGIAGLAHSVGQCYRTVRYTRLSERLVENTGEADSVKHVAELARAVEGSRSTATDGERAKP